MGGETMGHYDFPDDHYDSLFDYNDFEEIMDSIDIDLDLEGIDQETMFEDISEDMYNA
ncbi:MAG: hypothetical protein O3A77_01505 [bacterium]|nr:hypothetical protein [bacterium]